MDDLVFSILLVVLGLLIGLFIAFVINSIRVSVASKKIKNEKRCCFGAKRGST